jgi:hypothetical protein
MPDLHPPASCPPPPALCPDATFPPNTCTDSPTGSAAAHIFSTTAWLWLVVADSCAHLARGCGVRWLRRRGAAAARKDGRATGAVEVTQLLGQPAVSLRCGRGRDDAVRRHGPRCASPARARAAAAAALRGDSRVEWRGSAKGAARGHLPAGRAHGGQQPSIAIGPRSTPLAGRGSSSNCWRRTQVPALSLIPRRTRARLFAVFGPPIIQTHRNRRALCAEAR